MPSQIDIDKVAKLNPKVDLDEFRKGEEMLKALRESGTVRPSTYGLSTPESKKQIRPIEEQAPRPDCLPSFRKLR